MSISLLEQMRHSKQGDWAWISFLAGYQLLVLSFEKVFRKIFESDF